MIEFRWLAGAVGVIVASLMPRTPALAQTAYITNFLDPTTVSAIATPINKVTSKITVGTSPTGVAAAPNGSKVYVANQADNTVSVIATATNTVTATIPVGSGPFGLAVNPNGSRLYVANQGGGLTAVDTSINTSITTVDTQGATPVGVAVTPDGAKVYVTNQDSGTVTVIDAGTNSVARVIPSVCSGPTGVAVAPDGAKAYVACSNQSLVKVIDTATDAVSATIVTGIGNVPFGVAISPDSAKVFVSNSGSNSVSVIDTATGAVVAVIAVGSAPRGVSLTPDGSRLYVANFFGASVSVIATSDNATVATVPVGSGPLAFGNFIVGGNGPAAYAFTTGTIPAYATEAVAGSGGRLTVPASDAIQLAVSGFATSANSALSLTFTLPPGVTFTSNPVLTGDGTGFAATSMLTAGGSGSNSATFTVTVKAGATAGFLTLGTFTIAGAQSLQTPTISTSGSGETSGTGFTITEQITGLGGAITLPIQATGRSTGLASSVEGLSVFVSPSGFVTVDTSAAAALNGVAALGKVFGSGGLDSLTATLGFVTNTVTFGAVASDGITTFGFATAGSATMTLTGNFAGIASIYFDPAGGVCATSAANEAQLSGVVGGTISGRAAIFSNLFLSDTFGTVCAYAKGSSLIGANPSGLSVRTAIAGVAIDGDSPLGSISYSDGTPYFVSYTGDDPGYPTFLRIVNNSAADLFVFAYVQTDNGSPGSAVVEDALGPQRNDLVPVQSIIGNAGVATPNHRASLIVFAAPANGVIANAGSAAFGSGAVILSHLMLNPDGTAVQLGSNGAP